MFSYNTVPHYILILVFTLLFFLIANYLSFRKNKVRFDSFFKRNDFRTNIKFFFLSLFFLLIYYLLFLSFFYLSFITFFLSLVLISFLKLLVPENDFLLKRIMPDFLSLLIFLAVLFLSWYVIYFSFVLFLKPLFNFYISFSFLGNTNRYFLILAATIILYFSNRLIFLGDKSLWIAIEHFISNILFNKNYHTFIIFLIIFSSFSFYISSIIFQPLPTGVIQENFQLQNLTTNKTFSLSLNCISNFHKQGEVNYLFDGYLANCYFKNVSDKDKFNANINFYYVNGSYETFLTNSSNFSFIVSKDHSLMDVSLNLSNDKGDFYSSKKVKVNFITSDQYSSKRTLFFSFMGAFLSLILLVLPSFVSRWKEFLSLR